MITSQSTLGSRQSERPARHLEETADALLEAAGLLGGRRALHSETGLARKMRRERKRRAGQSCGCSPDQAAACVVEGWLEELIDVGGLTAIEEICFRLYYAGRSPRRIASDLRLPYRKVDLRVRSARRKLRRAYRRGPYAGWQEVYLAEVNRYIYRAPRHRPQ